jgi:hypothetical protein
MDVRKAWTSRVVLSCLIFNGILIGLFFLGSNQILNTFSKWLSPFSSNGSSGLPPDVQTALKGLNQLVVETDGYLAAAVIGVGSVVTLILIAVLAMQGRSLAGRREPVEQVGAADRRPIEADKRPVASDFLPPATTAPQMAVQLLAIFQREGRLIDFFREDLSLYSDDQIGAAVRSVHQGCKGALAECVELKPVLQETEGSPVTVAADFDPRAIRLTGNVSGDPPFTGILRHHGWRVTSVNLPRITKPQDKDWILAPAEVEIAD